MKLIVGSGGHHVDGWKSTEIDEIDICNALPFSNGTLEAIFASHVIEHVPSASAMFFLTECRRVLQAGGWLRLSVPIIGVWLERHEIQDLAMKHGHCCTYNEDLLRSMLYGAGFHSNGIQRVDFDPALDHHHLTIGVELDARESCRLIATKL